METGRYLKGFAALVFAGLGLMAAINLVVDPYASFRWHDLRGFNDQKHLKRGGGRVNKSVILSRQRFDVLFFGTSRAEIGFDPNSAMLGGAAAFNAAERNTTMTEIRAEALFAADHQRPRAIVVELDPLTFTSADDLSGAEDFAASAFAGRSLVPILLERLLSWRALVDSATVVGNSVRGRRDPFTKYGYFDRSDQTGRVDHRQLFAATLTESFLIPGQGYRKFAYRPESMTLLADIVARYQAMGTKVLLFITPVHARQMEAMGQLGLSPAIERWKRDLVALVAAANQDGRVPVRLWDFSGFNSVTTEQVPDVAGTPMRWYWESSHYTKATGDLVLARLFGRDAGHPDFGTELLPATIDADLAAIRDGRKWYGGAFAGDVAAVRRLVDAVPPR